MKFLVVLVLVLQAAYAEEDPILEGLADGDTAPPPGMDTISYKQPSLTEEEQKSHYFPDRYRCEACQIVVHNLGTDYRAAEAKIPKKKKRKVLGDIEMMETVEDVCQKEKFDKYSIQEFDGTVTFKGPAFPDRNAPGMSMGGGLWPVRYVNYCGDLFEDYSEDEVYMYYRQGNLFYELCMKKHCKGVLKDIPKPVDFKHSLTEEEQLCKDEKKCPNKSAKKEEL